MSQVARCKDEKEDATVLFVARTSEPSAFAIKTPIRSREMSPAGDELEESFVLE